MSRDWIWNKKRLTRFTLIHNVKPICEGLKEWRGRGREGERVREIEKKKTEKTQG